MTATLMNSGSVKVIVSHSFEDENDVEVESLAVVWVYPGGYPTEFEDWRGPETEVESVDGITRELTAEEERRYHKDGSDWNESISVEAYEAAMKEWEEVAEREESYGRTRRR